MVRILVRLENLAILAASLFLYYEVGMGLPMFLLLILVPDVSLLGYLINKRVGAVCYNLVHTYVLATALIMLGMLPSYDVLPSLGLILAAHIGMDRALGLGLKYPESFKPTHMQKI